MNRGEYAFRVRTYECGADGRATMATICNYLQESASVHAEELGFSKTNFDADGGNISWVLSRMAVKVNRYPKWEENVTVETFPRGGRRIVAWRDFIVKGEDGEILALATSEWMIIDLASRKVVPIPESVLSLVEESQESVLGPEPFTPRLRFPTGDSLRENAAGHQVDSKRISFRAQNSHIDLNGHVNNVHYVEWLMEPSGGRQPREMEIVFRSETFAGDEIFVETAPGASAAEAMHRVCAADGHDHAVAKLVFFRDK